MTKGSFIMILVVLVLSLDNLYAVNKDLEKSRMSDEDKKSKEVVISTKSTGIFISSVSLNRTNLEKLSDPDPMVRRNAVIYLGTEKKKENVPSLIKMLDDESPEVKRAAVNALSKIKDSRAVSPLIDKFKAETNLNLKTDIIIALGELKSVVSVPTLKSLLRDPYPAFRNEAVRALGKINSPETYKDIVTMLNDEAEGVRVITADVAGALKLRSSVPLLVKNLQDPVAVVRRACARAIGQIGEISALPELEKLMQDKDQQVISAAKEAMEKINKEVSRRKDLKK